MKRSAPKSFEIQPQPEQKAATGLGIHADPEHLDNVVASAVAAPQSASLLTFTQADPATAAPADMPVVDTSVHVPHADSITSSGADAGSSAASTSLGYIVPDHWKFVLDIANQAHFPTLGLPAQWEKATSAEHALIAYDPKSGAKVDIQKPSKKLKPSSVGFLHATKGHFEMPGTDEPASVRYQLFQDSSLQSALVSTPDGKALVPCLAHGDYVQVESLEADHAHAKSEIIKRQTELVEKLNTDPDFAGFVMSLKGMEKFFVRYNDRYYGTLYFYELYFNDIDNIWLICSACNTKKSAADPIEWFKNQWLYGDAFFDYLTKHITNDGLIKKLEPGEGLAQVAIEWFWKKHAAYTSTARTILEKIEIPLEMLGRQVDHVLGFGKFVRAERLRASLGGKMQFLESVMRANTGMAKDNDVESHHDSSDDEARLKIQSSREDFVDSVAEVALALPPLLENQMTAAIERRKKLGSSEAFDSREEEGLDDINSIYSSPS